MAPFLFVYKFISLKMTVELIHIKEDYNDVIDLLNEVDECYKIINQKYISSVYIITTDEINFLYKVKIKLCQ